MRPEPTEFERQMLQKLEAALQPAYLEIRNDSENHAGHASSPGTGISHFRVFVESTRFEGLGLVDRHRMVYDILKEELAGPVHALAVHAGLPGELPRPKGPPEPPAYKDEAQ